MWVKKYFLLIFLIVFTFATYSSAITVQNRVSEAAGGGGACVTTTDACSGTDDGSYHVGKYSNAKYRATKFVKSGTETICQAVLRLSKTNSPIGNLTVYFYTHDAANDQPDTVVAGDCTSDTVAASSVGAGVGNISFSGTSCSLTDSTTYWIVLYNDTVDIGDYINWYYESGDCSTERIERSETGSGDTWNNESSTNSGEFELYK
jgi:hypothetical protein